MSAAVVLLFIFLSSTTSAAYEQGNSFISIGSSLTPIANDAWLSSSRIFAFGFSRTPNGYAVCISYSTFFQRTVVWTANTDNPYVPHNVVMLLTNEGLVLQLEGNEYSRVNNGSSQPILGASMLDNGNFVVYNLNGTVAWQSFDHPTDSLVPGQRLTPGVECISRASKADLKTGMFRIKMQTDGNLVMYSVDSQDHRQDAYYATDTYGIGNNVSLYLGNDGHLYLFNGTSVVLNITWGENSVAGTFYLARMDADGIFRLYKRSSHRIDYWRSIWSPFEDKCMPKGVCGINSLCTYNNQQNVDCKCLPGFDFINSGDPRAGCTRNFTVDCADKEESSKFKMKRMQNVTSEDNYYSFTSGTDEESCAQDCLKDCSCNVAFFRDGECRKQRFPLRFGRRMPNIPDVAYVRVTKGYRENNKYTEPNKWRHSKLDKRRHPKLLKHVIIIGGLVGIVGLLLVSSIIIYYIKTQRGWCNQGKENEQNIDKLLLKHGSLAPKRFSCQEIKKITKCFADKLGQGGYGIVYKGKLPDGQLVAVKVLTETHDNAEEFINEVVSISRTSHVNIVNLLGFCYHRNKRALVYEFMPNKSLDYFIYKSRSFQPHCSLEWRILYEIAVGVARGLEYLHRGCNTRIIHFDIKPQNILLDEEFCPKISDFGLAKLCMKKQSVISVLGMRGTMGYIAPEVFSRSFGVVSHKSDVYSYGIMVLQMVEAKNVEMEWNEDSFLDKIYEHVVVQNERMEDLMSEDEDESERKMIMVGFWCIQTSPVDRPSMDKVVEMLEGKLQFIDIPPKPFLLSSPNKHYSYFISCNCNCNCRCKNVQISS